MTACPIPLVQDQEQFDREIGRFIDEWGGTYSDGWKNYDEPFLQNVAAPMCLAFWYHRQRRYHDAEGAVLSVQSPDWRLAGQRWIERRRVNWESKKEAR
jgi:hypothetical protein